MPAADPVTAIANALAAAGSALQPILSDHFAQKYESEHQKRMAEVLAILAMPDSPARADRLSAFVLRLLGSAGSPTGGVAGVVAVPLDVVLALVGECSEGIKKDAMLARVRFEK